MNVLCLFKWKDMQLDARLCFRASTKEMVRSSFIRMGVVNIALYNVLGPLFYFGRGRMQDARSLQSPEHQRVAAPRIGIWPHLRHAALFPIVHLADAARARQPKADTVLSFKPESEATAYGEGQALGHRARHTGLRQSSDSTPGQSSDSTPAALKSGVSVNAPGSTLGAKPSSASIGGLRVKGGWHAAQPV